MAARTFQLKAMRNRLWALIFVLAAFAQAHANVAFLLEEPYGTLGGLDPTGHAAVYLTGLARRRPRSYASARQARQVSSPADTTGLLATIGSPFPYFPICTRSITLRIFLSRRMHGWLRNSETAIAAPTCLRLHRMPPMGGRRKETGLNWSALPTTGSSTGFEIESTQNRTRRSFAVQRTNKRSHYNIFFSNCETSRARSAFSRAARGSTPATFSLMRELPPRSKLPNRLPAMPVTIRLWSFLRSKFRRYRAISGAVDLWTASQRHC